MDHFERMRDFVRSRGGVIRFDEFSREHLFGRGAGFYSHTSDMTGSFQGGVPTPSMWPVYAEFISRHILNEVVHKSEAHGKREVTFVEIGGGAGWFKRAFLMEYGRYIAGGGSLKIRYVSVEHNPNQRLAQRTEGTSVIGGSAQQISLRNGSADFVFSEELLDCMPFRNLKFDPERRKITHEAFVVLTPQGSLAVEYKQARRDADLRLVEKKLARARARTEFHQFSPDYRAHWKELRRVLSRNGTAIGIDYAPERWEETPERGARLDEPALQRPYSVDMTHGIDFGLQEKIARSAGFRKVRVSSVAALPSVGDDVRYVADKERRFIIYAEK